jgi:2,4-dienoyl-CoA reductase-like NADH-dependent reductase (Old Yellow Enzyme family)
MPGKIPVFGGVRRFSCFVSAAMSDPLFSTLQAGALRLPSRIVMAPLTRCRASAGRVPNPLMAEYYAQRASFGLILSEATAVSPMGVGYPDTPGIWSDEQVEGWKLVTKAVHDAGGQILLQLWHVGRISDPVYLDGALPLSASAVRPAGHVSLLRPLKDFVTPRALELDEIPAVIEEYRKGAENAMAAGFDGVEIHGANGYLIDQFLQDSTNHRTDGYGGSIENRARFMLEVTDAVVSVWGADRVGMHIAPRGDAHDMGDSDPAALFGHVASELGKRKLAFLCARESHDKAALGPMLKEAFGGVFIANEGFTAESAREAVASGRADAVAFGKPAIANPDLVARIRAGAPWNAPHPETFYGSGPKGYTDYPKLETSTSVR